MQMYRMELVAQEPLENDNPVTWIFRWWRTGKRHVADDIVVSSVASCRQRQSFMTVLEAYRAGVHWAMMEGPDDLCEMVISLDGKGY